MLQREGGFAIGKDHIAEGAVDGLIVECHGEVEVLIRLAGVARHGLGDGQTAGARIRNRRAVLGVGELGLCRLIGFNFTALAGGLSLITVLIGLGLCDRVTGASQEAGDCLALAMLQREGGFAIGKGHAPNLAGDGLIECHGEVEVLIRLASVARHGLGDGQAAQIGVRHFCPVGNEGQIADGSCLHRKFGEGSPVLFICCAFAKRPILELIPLAAIKHTGRVRCGEGILGGILGGVFAVCARYRGASCRRDGSQCIHSRCGGIIRVLVGDGVRDGPHQIGDGIRNGIALQGGCVLHIAVWIDPFQLVGLGYCCVGVRISIPSPVDQFIAAVVQILGSRRLGCDHGLVGFHRHCLDDVLTAAVLRTGQYKLHHVLAGDDGIIVEEYVILFARLFRFQVEVGSLGNIAIDLLCGQILRHVLNEHFCLNLILLQHKIGFRELRVVRIRSFLCILKVILVDFAQCFRQIVDGVAECLRADRRPLRGNVHVAGDRLVKGKHFLGLLNVPVYIRHVPAFQGVTALEGTGDHIFGGGIAPVGGDIFYDVIRGIAHRAAAQMEGHRIGGRIPDGVEPQVARDGEGVTGLALGLGVLIHGPLHVHAGGAKGPALERPRGRAVCMPVGADGGSSSSRTINIPAIFCCTILLLLVVGVLITQVEGVLLLCHLRAVGQGNGAQGHLGVAGGAVIDGRHVGDGVPVPVVVEIEVVGNGLSANRITRFTSLISIFRRVIRGLIRLCHVQTGAGVLHTNIIGGHGVHLPGHGVILGDSSAGISAHRIIAAVGIIVGDLITVERHPHQIVKVVFGDGLVVRGHQIQEVVYIRGVIVVNADTLHIGNVQVRHFVAVIVPIVADVSVKPVGNQVVPQAGILESTIFGISYRLLRIGNDLRTHGGVGAHDGGFARIAGTGIEVSAFIVLAVGGAPGDHSGGSTTITGVVIRGNVFLRPGNRPDVPQVRAVLGPDGDGLGDRHASGVLHIGAHPAIGIRCIAAAFMRGAVIKVQHTIRNRRAFAEAVSICAERHSKVAAVCCAIIGKQQLVDVPGEVDVNRGLAVGRGGGGVVVDFSLFLVHDLKGGLLVEVSHVKAAGLAHGRVELLGHLGLDIVQQRLRIIGFQQRRIGIDIHREAARVAVMGVGGPQLGLVGLRGSLIVGILRVIISSISTLSNGLHIVLAGQVLGPEDDAHLGLGRLPLGIQMQGQNAAALGQLGLRDQIRVDRQRVLTVRIGFNIDIISLGVVAVGIGRGALLQIPPAFKGIAGPAGRSNTIEVDIAAQRHLLSGDVGIVGVEDHAVGIRRLVINVNDRIRILDQLLGETDGLELFVDVLGLGRSAGPGSHAALKGLLIQADIFSAVFGLLRITVQGGYLIISQPGERLRHPVVHRVPGGVAAVVDGDVQLRSVLQHILQLLFRQRHFQLGVFQRGSALDGISAHSRRGAEGFTIRILYRQGAGIVPRPVVLRGVAVLVGWILCVVIRIAIFLIVVDIMIFNIHIEVAVFQHLRQLIRRFVSRGRGLHIPVQLAGVQHDAEALHRGQLPCHLIGSISLLLGDRLHHIGIRRVHARETAGVGIFVFQLDPHDIRRYELIIAELSFKNLPEHGPLARGIRFADDPPAAADGIEDLRAVQVNAVFIKVLKAHRLCLRDRELLRVIDKAVQITYAVLKIRPGQGNHLRRLYSDVFPIQLKPENVVQMKGIDVLCPGLGFGLLLRYGLRLLRGCVQGARLVVGALHAALQLRTDSGRFIARRLVHCQCRGK